MISFDPKTSADQRRQPRLEIDEDLSQLDPDTGAHLSWPNLELSTILNLSHGGAAVARPGLFVLNTTSPISVELHLGREVPVIVKARCVWRTIDKAGLEFTPLSGTAFLRLSEFLDYRLIGAQLRAVEPKYFAPHTDFTFWFQGPPQSLCHVFVWREQNQITRVQVEIRGERVALERGQRLRGEILERRARLILSQMDKAGLNMKDFVRTLQAGA